jgi:hypothetical protein
MDAYRAVFERQSNWGRLLDPPFEDIYWEYKSGTCIVFQQKREELYQCLKEFLLWSWQINDDDLVRLNLDMCVDFYRFEPFLASYRSDLVSDLFELETDRVIIHHRDRELDPVNTDIKKFCARVYHHRRKMKHWCCDITAAHQSMV